MEIVVFFKTFVKKSVNRVTQDFPCRDVLTMSPMACSATAGFRFWSRARMWRPRPKCTADGPSICQFQPAPIKTVLDRRLSLPRTLTQSCAVMLPRRLHPSGGRSVVPLISELVCELTAGAVDPQGFLTPQGVMYLGDCIQYTRCVSKGTRPS